MYKNNFIIPTYTWCWFNQSSKGQLNKQVLKSVISIPDTFVMLKITKEEEAVKMKVHTSILKV